MSIEYTTRDGEKVRVPTSMDPFKQLGIPSSASAIVTKRAVKKEVIKPKRQDRAMASLAYHMITSTGNQYLKKGTVYQLQSPDVFFFAAIGHRDQVIAEIEKNPQLVKSIDGRKRTVVYLAARCGFCDIVETLVRKGADVNHRQCVNSTPLHVAAFYGQKEIVKVLLIYGADPTLKNDDKHTPEVEASGESRKVFSDYKSSPFQYTVVFFNSTNLSKGMRYISYRGKQIGAEVFRSTSQLDGLTKDKWSMIQRDWEVAYHGTKDRYIKSILTHGLLPSGAKLPNGEMIRPPPGHIPLETTYAGVENWAKALFVSPSLMYASNQAYSEYVSHGNSKWCVVVKVYVKPSSYKTYNSTLLFKEQPIDGEPRMKEYRVVDSVDNQIFRIFSKMLGIGEAEFLRNVVVASIIFMDLNFRQDVKDFRLNYDDLRKLFN